MPRILAATLALVAGSAVAAARTDVAPETRAVRPIDPWARHGLGTADPAQGGDSIFTYGFESGNTLGWDQRAPPLPAPDVFRFLDLDLRDPHVFVDVPGFGCFDFTDTPLPLNLAPSFNETLEAAILGDDDGNGLLDLSVLLGFRPFSAAAGGLRLDQGLGHCLEPFDATTCDWRIPPVPRTTAYDGVAAGTCLEPLSGTTSGYVPAPAEPVGPCFVSVPAPFPFELFEIPFVLEDSQAAAEIVVAGGTTLETGLLAGFLTEADADSVLIPADVPLVGGQPLSVLLPGGNGNCAAGDDRDIHRAQPGWWFYLDYRAEPEPFVGQ